MSEAPRRASSSSAIAAIVPAASLEDVAREVRGVRARLDQHIDDSRFERERMTIRHDAIMSMLGDLIARMP